MYKKNEKIISTLKLIEKGVASNHQILYVSKDPKKNAQIRRIIKENYSAEDAKKMLSKIKFTTHNDIQRGFTAYRKETTIYEDVIEWLKKHDGQLMRGIFIVDGKRLKVNEMNKEQRSEVRLYERWIRSKEYKVLKEYKDYSIEEVPEEYREKIARLREIGLGITVYKQVIEWLEAHNGELPRSSNYINARKMLNEEMTEEQQKETNLSTRWRESKEHKILKEYMEYPLEEIPEEYREKIARLREFGLGVKEKTTYEQVIEWLETHDGRLPRAVVSVKGRNILKEEMTKDQQKEVKLYSRWHNSIEYNILKEYVGQSIEEVPEEYREKIAVLREFGLEKKTIYEQVIEWLETHEGQMMKTAICINGQPIKRGEMTKEQKKETNLSASWLRSKEHEILKEYFGQPIMEVPEEYREKIAKLREFGLGLEKKVYEQVIEWLETHEGQMMHSEFRNNGKRLIREEMTVEQKNEINLYQKWMRSREHWALEEYAGQPIEEVPEEYREKIARLREFGLGLEKSRLSNAKENRDEAKAQNDEAKKLQKEVSVELKKRGKKKHEEQ